MKVHYINILLFALPLNILVNSKKNTYIKYNTLNTKLIRAHRTLCECELNAPQNYVNDPEMKAVMQNFDRQTSQRFHEYNERMQEKSKKCKEQCDEDIQKIILKDKLEKQMEEHFSALEANLETNDIPKCVCEKSLEDKMEKACLRCTQNLGGIVAPSSGVLGGIGEFGLSVWKPAALEAAKEFAEKAGAAAGKAAGEAKGVDVVIYFLKGLGVEELIPGISKSIGNKITYYDVAKISEIILQKKNAMCHVGVSGKSICDNIAVNFKLIPNGSYNPPPTKEAITNVVTVFVDKAKLSADTEAANVIKATSSKIIAKQTTAINTTYAGYHTIIVASIVAIVVIVLIMVIIYLILRYRRKKKMKKKLQYIKLLEE
ncbi:hypothetical protein PFBG_00152 [Plasmodium falciparum 7G8]|uniref:Rifin n=1 Tax=Plasmodium falciparum (isolate 7G8) TaxID=57266 RepID=W7FV01_PLAF8|nr:hypothetical protein PFBG_00152 [Plasmodium falciparum 7G8]